MGNEQLLVTIRLDNSQYKREAKETASATGQIGREAKNTGTATGRMRNTLTRAGPLIKTGFALLAGSAIKNFADQAKNAFSNLNESLNAVQVSYGDATAGIQKLGRGAAESLGLSNAEFNTFAVQFSAFAQQIAGDGGDVVGVVDELSTRVSDFASVMNLEVAEAATLFQSGLAGETEPLRKYGVDLSAAAVEAHALAVGIVSSKSELDEQAKVLARHSLLMKQTDKVAGDFQNTIGDYANAQRVANAEAENQSAIIGEALVPAYEAMLPLQVKAAKTLGVMAVGFMDLIGQITDAEAAIKEFTVLMGEQEDQAAALLTIWSRGGVDLIELTDTMDLTADAVNRLREADDEFLVSLGLTIKEVENFKTHLADKLVTAQHDAMDAARHHKDAVDEQTVSIVEATDALQTQFDLLRAQVDPVFALINATNGLAEAQRATTDAVTEYGANSPEHQAALNDEATAWLDMRDAQIAVATQTGITREGFEAQLRGMRIFTDMEIGLILEDFDRVNAYQFDSKIVNVRTRHITGGGVQRAGGGPVGRHQMFRGGEGNRPELMIIPGDAGQVFSHVDSKRLLAALAGRGENRSTQIGPNYIASQADPNQIGDALMWKLRTSGV